MAHFTREYNSDILYATLLDFQAIIIDTTTVGSTVNVETAPNFAYAFEVMLQSQVVTDGTYVLFLEESPDGIVFTPVSTDYYVNNSNPGFPVTFDAGDNNLTRSVSYIGLQQYFRASVVSTGVTVGGTFGITVAELSHRHQPVEAQA